MKKLLRQVHHFFIPTQHNNYRARLLHLDVLVFLLTLTLVASTMLQAGAGVLGIATDVTIDQLYQLTNQQRLSHGLSTLTYNEQLSQAAAGKGADMFAKNYWAHYGPSGETPWSFILGAGYRYETAGENLAQGYMFSQNVMDAWMASPTHRENVLRGDYQDIGFAVVNGTLQGEPTTLVVQMFGKRVSQATTSTRRTVQVQAEEPESTPSPTIATGSSTKKVTVQTLPAEKTSAHAGISVNKASFNGSFLIIGLLIVALLLDLVYAYKLRILRVTGKNIAHLIFLGVVAMSLFLLSKGMIL